MAGEEGQQHLMLEEVEGEVEGEEEGEEEEAVVVLQPREKLGGS